MRFNHLRRREFITLRARMPVIRFLGATSPDTNADYLRAFRPGLKDSGYIEGESVAILTLEKATRRRLSKLGGARV